MRHYIQLKCGQCHKILFSSLYFPLCVIVEHKAKYYQCSRGGGEGSQLCCCGVKGVHLIQPQLECQAWPVISISTGG